MDFGYKISVLLHALILHRFNKDCFLVLHKYSKLACIFYETEGKTTWH